MIYRGGALEMCASSFLVDDSGRTRLVTTTTTTTTTTAGTLPLVPENISHFSF